MLLDREVLEQVGLIRHEGEGGLGRHRIGGQVVAGDPDPAARGNGDAGDALQGRRLAGAVGTHQTHDLAGLHLEGEVLDRGQVPVQLLQPLDLDHGDSPLPLGVTS